MKITKKEINETIKKIMKVNYDEKIFYKEIFQNGLKSNSLQLVAQIFTISKFGLVKVISIYNYRNEDNILHASEAYMHSQGNFITIF